LSLGPNGAVTGMPTQAETANFTVQVTSGTQVATQAFTLSVSLGGLIFQPNGVTFSGAVSGSDPADQTVTVTSSSSSTVSGLSITGISYGGVGGWLSATLSPATLSAPATLQLHAHVGSLAQGTYAGTVTVGSSSYGGTLPVTLNVGPPPPPPGGSLTGMWLYLVAFQTIDTQNQVTCVIATGSVPGAGPGPSEAVGLVLTQTNGTLQGTYPAMSYLCSSLTVFQNWSGTLPAGSVANGTVSGTTVNFDLASPAWHNTATYHADPNLPYMTGTLTVQLNLPGVGLVTESGDWGNPVYCDFPSACSP